MSEPAPPKLHHVVFCVAPGDQDRAASMWRDLGFSFEEIVLAEEGLRVLLDWSGGIEVVSPTAAGGSESERFEQFLRDRGPGVYSVVVLTGEVESPISVAAGHGATVRYQQHREHDGLVVDEADLSPVLGMAVTVLATNRPD